MLYNAVKRTMDVVGAVAGVIATLPVTLPTAAALYAQNDGKVFFRQERIGQGGMPFNILKFKTMTDDCDENGELLPDEQRVTKLGGFLRKHGLDELPELIDVALGNMALIGPRPLVPHELAVPPEIAGQVAWLDDRMEKRNQLKPGLVSRAAVAIDPKAANWELRFDDDVVSARCPSIARDIGTLFLAAKVAIVGRKSASDNCAKGHCLSDYLEEMIATKPQYQKLPEHQPA